MNDLILTCRHGITTINGAPTLGRVCEQCREEARTAVIRFELEMADGSILRLTGEAAQKHVEALNAACSMAAIHGFGMAVPPPFEVFKRERT